MRTWQSSESSDFLCQYLVVNNYHSEYSVVVDPSWRVFSLLSSKGACDLRHMVRLIFRETSTREFGYLFLLLYIHKFHSCSNTIRSCPTFPIVFVFLPFWNQRIRSRFRFIHNVGEVSSRIALLSLRPTSRVCVLDCLALLSRNLLRICSKNALMCKSRYQEPWRRRKAWSSPRLNLQVRLDGTSSQKYYHVISL